MKQSMAENVRIVMAMAAKDIGDVIKNRGTLINLVVILGMVVFFYWVSAVRPWDKQLDVAVYDEGGIGLIEGKIGLADGYQFRFIETESLRQMKRNVRFEHVGVQVPAGFGERLAAGEEAVLTGYVMWGFRGRAPEWEALFSEKFSELFEAPVRLEIGENFVIQDPDVRGTLVNFHILFATLFLALSLVPALMMEEKQTKTMDALMVSPASAGQIVMGKALAGLFYVMLGGGLFFGLNWAHVVDWGLAVLAFFLCAAFSIGLALILGSFVPSVQQMSLWMLPVMIFLIVTAFFVQESFLAPGLRAFFSWLPTSAMVNLFHYALSKYAPADGLILNLGLALAGTAAVYVLVVWKVRQADR